MWKRIISVIGATLAVCIAVPATAGATSGYDDIINKVSTKTLIHHIDNYSGKTCGSPDDDYAKKWLFAFKQKRYYSGDPKDHQAAVESLERAMSSPKGAYAVVYEQNNKHNDTSNPYFIKVFWTEDGKDDYTYRFYKNHQISGIYLTRKEGSQSKLYVATVASPKLILGGGNGSNCAPEYLWGYKQSQAFISDMNISAGSNKKLFTSTFPVDYPSGYAGPKFPDNRSAIGWWPDSSQYDDFTDKITIKKLINYINYHKVFCAPADYSNSWFTAFKYPNIPDNHKYHKSYMASLERAMATGAYAVAYGQVTVNGKTVDPHFITVFWSESRDDFYIKFLGDAPYRTAFITHKWGSRAELHGMIAGSVKPLQARGGCEVEFLQGNYLNGYVPTARFNESYMPLSGGNDMKIFTSTFDVEYPDGYKGKPIPGDRRNIKYLALGDSFSSGEGDTDKNPATDRKYYRQWTDVNEDKAKGAPKEKCHVSTRSYPYKLANWMGLGSGPSAAWASVACSGATVYDMNWDSSGGYEGQGSPLGRLHGYDNKGVLQKMALNEMIPGRVKQIEFVKKYQPKVITLTAGGNDVGFGKKIKDCVHYIKSIGTCDWAKDEMNTLGSQIKGQFDRVVGLYKELKAASPKSKIYAIGYPQFITDAEPAACGLNAGAIDLDERRMIVRATQYMNEVIEAAARKAGVKYVDISQALNGGKMCEKHQIYMTGIVGLGEQESYHPNKLGHVKIFTEIAKQLDHEDLSTYSKYPTAGDESVNAPSSIYFDKGAPSSVNTTILASTRPSKGSKQRVALAKNSLQPGSSARVEIRSKPVDLGSYTVLNDGSMKETITIPDNIPAGYHTLFIYGKSASGEDIKITQTLLVTGKDKEDLDDDGVKDTNQPCGAFLKTSGKDEDLDGIDDACDPEITDPILYTARNGRSSLGEDEDRIYLFRNTRAANLTGVTNDYVDKSKNQNNADALVGHTLSEETRGLAFDKLVIMKEADGDIKKGTPIILAKDVNEKCYALKPEDYLSPALKPGSKDYKLRGLIKLDKLPKGVGCEE